MHGVVYGPVLAGTLAFSLFPCGAMAVTFKMLYKFTGGTDGGNPQSGLVLDKKGNLYGTALYGGANKKGVVFRVAPNGTEKVLYSFGSHGDDGANPAGALQGKKSGVFYGTTMIGGQNNTGTVFQISRKGAESVLYQFAGGNDGDEPQAGGLTGTTLLGGTNGLGTAYEIADGHETFLHSFGSGSDGAYPYAALIADKAGNLYGTASSLGLHRQGVVFELTPGGAETILYSFCAAANCADGAAPRCALQFDSSGNLYGTTGGGGANNEGTVFKLSPRGTETVLYSFCTAANCTDGAVPFAGVIGDPATGLYGTTYYGGMNNAGTVFSLAPDGMETVLHAFDESDGYEPSASLVMDKKGNLYGTTSGGGGQETEGNVFEISP
jgi:uncharacterized repeat protein (TIGR03803 family)